MTARASAGRAAPTLARALSLRIPVTLEGALYAAIFGLAFALRFWDLGARALHHDESIHAQWAWNLLRGDYSHSPIFHGPLYYHAQGFVFLILGSTDYTARVSAAIFGMAMVSLPLLLRRQLGAVGTVAATAFIAFSPTLVYFSRFLREDIYVAVFVLGMVIGIVRYLEEGRLRWLAMLGLSFAGAVLTKEGAFLTTAVFLTFLDLHLAADLAAAAIASRPEPPAHPLKRRLERFGLTLIMVPIAWVVAALWPFLGGFRRRAGLADVLPRSGDALVVLGTFALPLLTPASRHYLLEPLGIIDKDRLSWEKVLQSRVTADNAWALVLLFATTTTMAAFAGLNWRPRFWAATFLAAAAIYLTLMTSFWTNLNGLVSGPWGSLDYWVTQQGVARGDQPWFYYGMLMPAYEFLPLVIALGGLWWAVFRGSTFSRLLAMWMFGQWLALSYASEKMPWNNTHIALPTCLLAAWTVHHAWEAWRPRVDRPLVALLAGIAAIACGGMLVVAWAPGALGNPAGRLTLLVLTVAAVVLAARPLGRHAAGAVVIVAVIGGLAFFSARAMVMAAFERGDVPKDLLIYTQSSPDIAQLAREIDRLAEATGKGYNLKIAVDGTDSFAWPWAWYLRDYKGASYPDFSGNVQVVDYDVILVNASNVSKVNAQLEKLPAPRFAAPQRYPHRWWFDETYKEAMDVGAGPCTALAGDCGPFRLKTWRHLFGHVFDGSWPRTWLLYIRDHDPHRPSGSIDAYAFFPANYDRDRGRLLAAPVTSARPSSDSAGRPVIGGYGVFPGQFVEPIDVEADSAGNLFVIDRVSKKLQKFDAGGNFIAAVDIRVVAGDPAEAAEPWGLAIGPRGEVIVADTFGWRIRVFDAALQPLVTFGKPPEQGKPPGEFDLFGPRDAAFDAEGNFWVTDTGHDRIMVYTLRGDFVRQVGSSGKGPGQFDEPVGISIAADGTVFVADMFNRRVQLLDQSGRALGSFTVEGWGGLDATDKPYLRALADGRVAVSLPLLNEVRVYTRAGKLEATIAPDGDRLNRPYGMAQAADGRLWVVEGGNGRLRLFDIP